MARASTLRTSPGSSSTGSTRPDPESAWSGCRSGGLVRYPNGRDLVVAPLHILSALALVFLVLLHSGKGGGLSDMFGGGAGAAAAGSTVVERNLDRITVLAALVFGFTSMRTA